MKKFLLFSALWFCAAGLINAQDIPQNQVPSVVINSFKQAFPKAYDIEWEMQGEGYQVDFETGFSTDHQVWYDKTGKMLRHEEEIPTVKLPEAVKNVLAKNYAGYRVDGVEKITVNDTVSYKTELESGSTEWTVIFDSEGNELEKKAD